MTCAVVPRLARAPGGPADPGWDALPPLEVAQFHARSSAHRPGVRVQLGHTGDRLHLRFSVRDAFVVSRVTRPNGPVCQDSCVEFFVEPLPGLGYFNFEFNAGGTRHASHITDPRRVGGGFAGCALLGGDELAQVEVRGTLPAVVDPEVPGPLDWALCATIPVALFAGRLGRAPPVPGTWRGNFYKCADRSSRPHWASWAPIGETLSFHQPDRFGTLRLG